MPHPIRAHERETVGHRKEMSTNATLFRDGLTVVETYTKNKSWNRGLRGHVFVIMVDSQGRAVWATKEFKCTTRCSRTDPSCPSRGDDTFRVNIPEKIAAVVTSLDIVQDDRRSENSILDNLKRILKGTLEAYNDPEIQQYAQQIGTIAGSIGS